MYSSQRPSTRATKTNGRKGRIKMKLKKKEWEIVQLPDKFDGGVGVVNSDRSFRQVIRGDVAGNV
jgi:hypothetical protein